MSTTTAKTMPALLGARGVATAAVVAAHLSAGLWPAGLEVLFHVPGTIAVPFFFVLSGYLLTWNWRPDRPMARYAVIRFGRIWPGHAVMWCVWIALSLTIWQRPVDEGLIPVANLFLVHAWVPDSDWQLSMNGPTWTLSCEVFLYAILPLLVVGEGRIRTRRAVVAAVISTALIGTVIIGATSPTIMLTWPPSSMLALVLGIATAHAMRTRPHLDWTAGWARRLTYAILVVMAIIVIAAAVVANVNVQRPDEAVAPLVGAYWLFTMPLAALVVGRLSQRDQADLGSRLHRPVWRTLGTYSYPIYLTHIPAIFTMTYLAEGAARTVGGAIVLSAGALVLTALMSVLLQRFVERPAYLWLTARPIRRGVGA